MRVPGRAVERMGWRDVGRRNVVGVAWVGAIWVGVTGSARSALTLSRLVSLVALRPGRMRPGLHERVRY